MQYTMNAAVNVKFIVNSFYEAEIQYTRLSLIKMKFMILQEQWVLIIFLRLIISVNNGSKLIRHLAKSFSQYKHFDGILNFNL